MTPEIGQSFFLQKLRDLATSGNHIHTQTLTLAAQSCKYHLCRRRRHVRLQWQSHSSVSFPPALYTIVSRRLYHEKKKKKKKKKKKEKENRFSTANIRIAGEIVGRQRAAYGRWSVT